jgi:uncharacterized LabA/DUF88 family protein
MHTRIFVDFWNLQLTINEHVGYHFRIDWLALSPHLITVAEASLSSTLQFDGTKVYLSYDSRTALGRKLYDWSLNTLDRFPGVKVVAKTRQVKREPKCPSCHARVKNCPHCGAQMIGTIEKGIDTAIATDMISLAWESAWDVAILVSSDKDFIPVVEFLATKGKRVLNAHLPPHGIHLARTCWASIDLRPLLASLERQ